MRVEFSGLKVCFRIRSIVKKSIVQTMKFLKQDHRKLVVSVAFLSLEEIRELNKQTREFDKATDVLSYPSFNLEPYQTLDINENMLYKNRLHLGDMALCLDKAKEQAKEYDVSLESEVKKLSIHSALHLMGFDHIEDADYEIMNKAETQIANMFLKNI